MFSGRHAEGLIGRDGWMVRDRFEPYQTMLPPARPWRCGTTWEETSDDPAGRPYHPRAIALVFAMDRHFPATRCQNAGQKRAPSIP